MALPKHPDFAEIQSRLRRLNPSFYPTSIQVDDQYGPTMARGLDALLDLCENENGLAPWGVQKAVSGKQRLEPKFQFLLRDPVAPMMLRMGIELLGIVETPGPGNNSIIIDWADEVADVMDTGYAQWAGEWYQKDSIPWCGLFQAVIALRSAQGREDRFPPVKYLSALEWAKFGVGVDIREAAVGDVMVMKRKGGGHVTTNCGMEEGGRRFFGLGGNQRDSVNILPFDLDRVVAVRRPPYSNRPAGARQVILRRDGTMSSSNEA